MKNYSVTVCLVLNNFVALSVSNLPRWGTHRNPVRGALGPT